MRSTDEGLREFIHATITICSLISAYYHIPGKYGEGKFWLIYCYTHVFGRGKVW